MDCWKTMVRTKDERFCGVSKSKCCNMWPYHDLNLVLLSSLTLLYLVSVVHAHSDTGTIKIVDDPLLGLTAVLGREGHLEATGTLSNEVSGLVLYKMSSRQDPIEKKQVMRNEHVSGFLLLFAEAQLLDSRFIGWGRVGWFLSYEKQGTKKKKRWNPNGATKKWEVKNLINGGAEDKQKQDKG